MKKRTRCKLAMELLLFVSFKTSAERKGKRNEDVALG